MAMVGAGGAQTVSMSTWVVEAHIVAMYIPGESSGLTHDAGRVSIWPAL
jgi:hypothetical protein